MVTEPVPGVTVAEIATDWLRTTVVGLAEAVTVGAVELVYFNTSVLPTWATE